ncbi:MAG: hypothetical protein KIT43_08580 [Bauldia sp.]|nr:hypothetical protein [Bauldia sp.]MCW5716820.1 hypothetical protein [Bauldia sp.]
MLTIDHGPHGSAHFRTTVEVTGDTIAYMPFSAMQRLVCLYFLGRMDESALDEACVTLRELYSHQEERLKADIDAPRDFHRLAAKPALRTIERQPFYISD